MKNNKIYKELGKLLYSIAMADGKIQQKELKEFKDFVSVDLVPLEGSKDEFGTDNAFYAEFEFESLKDLNIESELAFESFLEFYRRDKEKISAEMKALILLATERLAASNRGVSKSEALLLDRLKKEIV
jgi:hypothetical protein